MKKNSNLYHKNIDLLMDRFHQISFLLSQYRSASFKSDDRQVKKFDLDLENIDVLCVYKLAQGKYYKNVKNWLREKNDRILIFLEDEIEEINAFLHTEIASDILLDNQVHLFFIEDEKKSIQEIAYNFPSIKVDVISSYESEKFSELRAEIIKRFLVSCYMFNDKIKSDYLFQNLYANMHRIKNSFFINLFKDKFKDTPAIICGAGPSIKQNVKKIKDLQNKALIIAGGSGITMLSTHDISPHFGIVIDPNKEAFDRLKNHRSFEMPIIYSSRAQKTIFNLFNGPLGYIKAGIGGIGEVWMEEELNIDSEFIAKDLDEYAQSVTSVCLSLAVYLGCNPIIVDGIDLSFDEKKYYSDEIKHDDVVSSMKELPDMPIVGIAKDNSDIYTSWKFEIEAIALSNFAEKHPDKLFINTTKKGLKIQNILDLSIDEVSEKYLKKQLDIKAYFHSLIQNSFLKLKDADITKLKEDLIESFNNSNKIIKDIIKSLEEENNGSFIVSEIDLKDELAYKIFLFEVHLALDRLMIRSNLNNEIDKYKELQIIVDKYLQVN